MDMPIENNDKPVKQQPQEASVHSEEAGFGGMPAPEPKKIYSDELANRIKIPEEAKKKSSAPFVIATIILAIVLSAGFVYIIQNLDSASKQISNSESKKNSNSSNVNSGDQSVTNSNNELSPGSSGNGGNSQTNSALKYCSNPVVATLAC